MKPTITLYPKDVDACLKSKAKFIKLLSNGKLMIVHAMKSDEKVQVVSIWTV